MNLLDNEKINSCDFINIFLNILIEKNINEFDVNDLKYSLDYFSILEENKELFNKIYPNIDINQVMNILSVTKSIFCFDSIPDKKYILNNQKINDYYSCNLYSLIYNLVEKYIELINKPRLFNNIKKINPNNLSHKILYGINNKEEINVDLITDGNIRFLYDVKSKGYYTDVDNNNVILLLQNLKMQKIILENATFAVKQIIKNDSIKNTLYAEKLNEQSLSSVYKNLNIQTDSKIKRISIK